MDLKDSIENILDSLKMTFFLFAYSTVLTILTWLAMFIVSFIPIIGQGGPEHLYNFKEITIFGVGILWGILSIFMLISKTDLEIKRDDKEVIIKL